MFCIDLKEKVKKLHFAFGQFLVSELLKNWHRSVIYEHKHGYVHQISAC